MIPRARVAVAYATGMTSHARQVKGDDPDIKVYPDKGNLDFRMKVKTNCI
jgi:hypothetical protein